MLVNIDEIYDLALKAKDDPYGHPVTQVLDNFDNFRCLLTPSFLIELIILIREAEKDAARYRWLIDNSVFGMKQNGVSWSLQFDGPAPEHSGKIGECIDQAMKEKGYE